MIVVEVEGSHERAADRFSLRRYVAAPIETPYPPGLAPNTEPVAAVSRESCIVHAEVGTRGSASKEVALTPSQSTPDQWLKQYSDYRRRQVDKNLRAAFCKFELIDRREALAARFDDAPVMSRVDWENRRQQVRGLLIQDATAKQLAKKIAEHGQVVFQ
jgi:hypothetical protein